MHVVLWLTFNPYCCNKLINCWGFIGIPGGRQPGWSEVEVLICGETCELEWGELWECEVGEIVIPSWGEKLVIGKVVLWHWDWGKLWAPRKDVCEIPVLLGLWLPVWEEVCELVWGRVRVLWTETTGICENEECSPWYFDGDKCCCSTILGALVDEEGTLNG